MNPLQRIPKKIIKGALVQLAAGLGRHRRKPARPELLILMYHRVLPASDARARLEEPGMWVSPQSFRLHLQTLQQFFTPVSLSDWLRRQAAGEPLPDRACAVTFDDGWLDNHEFAWPLLREYDIPATIFLVAGMIGSRQHFWPNRLAWLLDRIGRRQAQDTQSRLWQHDSLAWLPLPEQAGLHRPDAEQLSAVIAAIKSLPDDEIHHRLDRIEHSLDISGPTQPSLLDWEQIGEMQHSGLVEVGSHTCRHIRLRQDIGDDVLQEEILQSRRLIEQQLQCRVDTFCYPNGDVSPAAEALVRANYLGAVTTQSGWNHEGSDAFRLQRIGVHEDISNSRSAFLACLSGWL